jgi:DNA-binding CsgD family transcriptional regulator
MTESATSGLVAALKQQFKARGIGYMAVAAQLAVSEATVKRYLKGQGLTVQTLEKMAAIAGQDLLSLVQAAQEPIDPPALTLVQETVLRSDRPVFTVYFLLSHGLTPEQIALEFGLGAKQLESYLVRLEKMGVIRRLATRVKVLTRTQFGETLHGRINEFSANFARQFLNEIDLYDERGSWAIYSVPLSPRSVRRLREMMAKVFTEMRAMSREDVGLPTEKREWYRLFAAVEPANPKTVFPKR